MYIWILIVLTFLAHCSYFYGEWDFLTYDDNSNFIEHEHVFNSFDLSHLKLMFTTITLHVYEPGGWILKAIVFALFGLNSRAYRITSLGLHCACSILLYYLLRFKLLPRMNG